MSKMKQHKRGVTSKSISEREESRSGCRVRVWWAVGEWSRRRTGKEEKQMIDCFEVYYQNFKYFILI